MEKEPTESVTKAFSVRICERSEINNYLCVHVDTCTNECTEA